MIITDRMEPEANVPAWKPELDAIVGARHGGAAELLLPRLRDLDARHPHTPEILYQLAWTSDVLGREREAAGFYERAIALGLPPNELSGAMLGFGSTLRCLGEYARAEQVLRSAKVQFPEQREFDAFLAMTLHNLGRHAEAMQLLLTTLIETADDIGIASHQRAIRFYSDKLDQKWE